MTQQQRAVKIHGENIGRSLRKQYKEASEPSWYETGMFFHRHMKDERFTTKHAKEADYAPRDRRYQDRKYFKFGHRNPLEYSGRTKQDTRSVRITSRGGTGQAATETTKTQNQGGVKLDYSTARRLRIRNPFSKIDLTAEFVRLTTTESLRLAHVFLSRFEPRFSKRG